MELLTNLVNVLASDPTGMVYIGIGLMAIALAGSGVMEGAICMKTVESMARNPEMYSKLRTSMIIGCALTETTAIYALVIAILMLFVG
jgi:F-type H+-transporting ATPase subunit c